MTRTRRPRALLALALIALILSGLRLYSDQAVRKAETAYPPLGAFVTSEGTSMHYLSQGSGQPVVLIHGSDGMLQDFVLAGLVDRLAADYHVIAIDRPGHGYSERPEGEPLTVGLNARLIRGALAELGIQKPILVGHSYGGPVALQYAVDYPEEIGGLLLLAPGAFSASPALHPMYAIPEIPILGPLLLNTLLVPVGQWLVPTLNQGAFYPVATPPEYLAMMKGLGVRPKQFTAYTMEWRAYHESMTALAPHYGEIQVPVTIIAGAEDRLTPLNEHAAPLHQAVPGSTLTVLAERGHEIHYQHPEVVLEALKRLASMVWPGI